MERETSMPHRIASPNQAAIPRKALLLLGFSALVAACSFDSSALDGRPPCDDDSDCARGICVDGSCFDGTTIGDAGDDTGLPDVNGDIGEDADTTDVGGDVDPDGADVTPDTEECEPGDRACEGEQLVECDEAGTPVVVAVCTDSSAWCSDEGGAHCEPQACAPNAVRCTDDATAVEECDARGSGWGAGDACGTDEICDNGECVDAGCEPNTVRCVGPFAFATCDEAGESSVISACTDGTWCSDNGDGTVECLPQTCTPTDRRCLDGVEGVEVCDERGSGYTVRFDCDDTEYCREGICTARTCAPGTTRCAGDFAYLTCDDRGASQVMSTCGEGTYCAASGGGVECAPQTCSPGARRCRDATTVEVCDTRGAAWSDFEACGAEQACSDGACTSVICTPNAFECTGGLGFRTCNAVGTAWGASTCAPGTFCDAPGATCRPQSCTPGARRCEGADLMECNGEGSAYALSETCAYGCTGSACNPPVCGDGIVATTAGELCDDGNTNPCDGCNACVLATGLRITTTSLTTSAVVWQPLEADFTIEGWVNVTAGGALFGVGSRTDTDYAWAGVEDGVVAFEFATAAGDVVRVAGTSNMVGTGWHHVAVSRFDRWGAAIFVDGRIEAIAHAPKASTSIDASTVIWIGSQGSTTPAQATLDAVRISLQRRYSVPFTPVRNLTTDGSTLALYHFDGSAVGALVDSSGNGRNLTLTGGSRVPDACYGATQTAITCGDGVRASWEECDDGNTTGGDGCSPSCLRELCPAGETRGPSDHCYYISTTGRRWTSARDNCAGRGANSRLVTIDSKLENDWIAFFLDLGSSHWIGLYDGDFGDEGNYRWVRGDSGYRNWAPGEPNNGADWTTDEDCIQILGSNSGNYGLWNDEACNSEIRSVCERY